MQRPSAASSRWTPLQKKEPVSVPRPQFPLTTIFFLTTVVATLCALARWAPAGFTAWIAIAGLLSFLINWRKPGGRASDD
ncbi:MAG TPA: hypothetical protein VGX76_14720 [Pirellulales bacterium]|jgi:hypothetical protein|nr:hypothetical protein [Pirellulales bacterium]